MMQFAAGQQHYYIWIPLALVAIAVAITIAFVHSRSGQYAQAVRDDEDAAASLGRQRACGYRLLTVALSCAITAVAGVFYTQYYMFVDPDQRIRRHVSSRRSCPAVIGGIGTIWGPIIGALIVGPLSEVTASLLRNPPAVPVVPAGQERAGRGVYAVLLIVIVLFLPQGHLRNIRERVRGDERADR